MLAGVPLLALGLATAVVALLVARVVANTVRAGLRRSGAGTIAVDLISKLVRGALYFVAVLFALSVAGVPVGSVLGAMAVFGIALVPNHDVFTNPLTNLTRRGRRRTRVVIGVDYDDDHNQAREVIREAVQRVEGVHDDPPVQVMLTELGDSSVNFEVRYWTDPQIAEVAAVQDRVLSDAKSALDDAGLTIPWPVRTLVIDTPITVERNNAGI